MRTALSLGLLTGALALGQGVPAALADSSSASDALPGEQRIGQLEAAFRFTEQMPTGVTVTRDNRRFVSYPRWGDGNAYTVAELKDGRAVPYPDRDFNRPNAKAPAESLISVQSVVAPGDGHLWLLDTGTLPDAGYQASGQLDHGPKLVAIDLDTNRVDRTIVLPDDAALDSTYLNDVRFDFSHGEAGVAYITDSSFTGPGAIIVVDLASGEAWRRLDGHPSTQAEPDFVPVVEGQYMTVTGDNGEQQINRVPADGIALSPDGSTLYYSALSGRHLYSVPTRLLRDRDASAREVEEAVVDHGQKGASDGLAMDNQGRLYATDYEHNAIHRLDTRTGQWQTIAHDPRLLWPDTLSIGPDGGVFVTANQLERQAQYHDGEDQRQRPFVLYRIKADAQPIDARQ
ncbi:sugar lactone lactonase YvrE [Kushneria sinocarnis]|uniref:Sugar lactone lactonase YvrE n=1 Tax=Kushneria sinocarnis TaxID=595502 RepID=A0A420X0Y0_9GAMM|nr:L-dopachrome tautomerase-related protein [Kushneria sinocarnis]RKR07516.1 sugar lactone lactonase YvrE [Kushneria sinocarnis]